jgi:hypothetical protein
MFSVCNNSAYEFGPQGRQRRPSFMRFGNSLKMLELLDSKDH